jgi:hypothetical protein
MQNSVSPFFPYKNVISALFEDEAISEVDKIVYKLLYSRLNENDYLKTEVFIFFLKID